MARNNHAADAISLAVTLIATVTEPMALGQTVCPVAKAVLNSVILVPVNCLWRQDAAKKHAITQKVGTLGVPMLEQQPMDND
jgi:hypothetical protein